MLQRQAQAGRSWSGAQFPQAFLQGPGRRVPLERGRPSAASRGATLRGAAQARLFGIQGIPQVQGLKGDAQQPAQAPQPGQGFARLQWPALDAGLAGSRASAPGPSRRCPGTGAAPSGD